MKNILITGVSGEIASSLVDSLNGPIIGLDIVDPAPEIRVKYKAFYKGDISNPRFIQEIRDKHEFSTIFHLAAILSSGGEKNPLLAHEVNVTGTLNILELARVQSERTGVPVKVIFPSTIAIYGIPTLQEKIAAGKITEEDFLSPVTMYGANKLYAERLGAYYSKHFGLLEDKEHRVKIDFRCVRFPGILSPDTLPSGGTSDFAPEMVHAVAANRPYTCFVRPDSKIPFMVMSDAIRVLTMIAQAKKENLTQEVYNVTAFSPSAEEIATLLKGEFKNAKIDYAPHTKRQMIVDSWPEAIDDSAARRDWGWKNDYSLNSGFFEYLVPRIMENYFPAQTANV